MTENTVHVSPVTGQNSSKADNFGVRHRRSFVISIVIGVLMAVMAPLQTSLIPFFPRLAYWEILMLSGATIGLGVTEVIERWGRLRAQPWLEIPVSGVLIALPLTMIVMSAGSMFFGDSVSGPIRFAYNFGITALISTAITALMYMIGDKNASEAPASPQADVVPAVSDLPAANSIETRFAQRLPMAFRSLAIQALQAEDHYLRVYFADGQSTLILMRLSDAIAELPMESGAQTHRSWWVAKDAVRKVSKSDGRATLTLEHGIEAPVSRRYYKALNGNGWLS
jgi:DNA-binding LytR/AlgR family response regulator